MKVEVGRNLGVGVKRTVSQIARLVIVYAAAVWILYRSRYGLDGGHLESLGLQPASGSAGSIQVLSRPQRSLAYCGPCRPQSREGPKDPNPWEGAQGPHCLPCATCEMGGRSRPPVLPGRLKEAQCTRAHTRVPISSRHSRSATRSRPYAFRAEMTTPKMATPLGMSSSSSSWNATQCRRICAAGDPWPDWHAPLRSPPISHCARFITFASP